MGKIFNIRYENEGYGIVIPLSQFNTDTKYKDYSVSCHYQYIKQTENYSLTMWLMHAAFDGKFGVQYEGIDTQEISGTRETIRENICRIVNQAMVHNYFDRFIERFEYDMKCCEKGAEFIEQEGNED